MEFSFGTKRWVPAELLDQEVHESNKYALGLHAPGFFDKVLNVNKCLLQSDAGNQVYWSVAHSFPCRVCNTVRVLVTSVNGNVDFTGLAQTCQCI